MTTPVPVTANPSTQAFHLARGIPTSRVIDPSDAGSSAADDHAAPFVRKDTFTPAVRVEGVEEGRGERSSRGHASPGDGDARTIAGVGEADVDSPAAEVSGRGIDVSGGGSGAPPPVTPARGTAALVAVGEPIMAHGDVPEKVAALSGIGVVQRHGEGTGATIVEFDESGVHLYDAFHFPTSRVEADDARAPEQPAPGAPPLEHPERAGISLTA